MLIPPLPFVVAERTRLQLKVHYSPGRFNENAHTQARTRSHANEGDMQSGFDRIANATRVHTCIEGDGRCLFEHPLLKSRQRPLNHSFRSLIVNVPRAKRVVENRELFKAFSRLIDRPID